MVEPNVPRPSTKLTRAWSRQWETSVSHFGLEFLRTRKCFYLLSTTYFDPGPGFENQCLDTGIVVILSEFRPVILFDDAEQYRTPKYSLSTLAGAPTTHINCVFWYLLSSSWAGCDSLRRILDWMESDHVRTGWCEISILEVGSLGMNRAIGSGET